MNTKVLIAAIVGLLVLCAVPISIGTAQGGGDGSSAKVDPKDPTPGTPGRLTEYEEEVMRFCTGFAEHNSLPDGTGAPEALERCWRSPVMYLDGQGGVVRPPGGKGIDADAIKERNRQAHEEGYMPDFVE
jgi:hypothetical protein